MDNVLDVKNLKVIFPGATGIVRAVEGVDIQIKRGECLALVGESGCGKSVTSLACMKLLGKTAVYKTDQHLISSEDVTNYNEKKMQELRGSKISIIFQDALSALNPVMSIGKQIDEIFIKHQKMSKKEAKQKSIEALALVGINDPKNRYKDYPHELSGGMRQRVLIAMAFACKPDVIIADEPTTALDVTIQAQVLQILSKLQKEHQTALLLITHDLSVVRHMADRVAVMYSGKIVETAKIDQLINHPLHPYTKGLINSVATMEDENEKFIQVPGNLPNPIHKPKGCYFAPRCQHCTQICLIKMPKLRSFNGGKVRCHHVTGD